MKKISIVYYSLTGNTEYAARCISKYLNADLIRINPIKEYPDKGFKKYYWCGKSAVMKEEPPLEKYKFDSDKYDLIIFGSPVWAGYFTPPLKTFIKENKDSLKSKKIAAFVCLGGSSFDKPLNKLKEELDIKEFVTSLALIDGKDKENNIKIKEFCNEIERLI